MPTEDKRVGKLLPSPVTPSSTVCYIIEIPNAVQYRAAFLGQLNVLGISETWDHPTDGTQCVPCEEAAQLWRNAIYRGVWSDDCEGDMSCDDVADCIDTNENVKRAIGRVVDTTASPGSLATPGIPMTAGQSSAQINPIDGCDPDELWAQCEQLVDAFIQAGTDLLENIELYSNTIEAAGFIEMIPFLGTAFDELQVDQFLEFIDWVVEVLSEAYAAGDTPEARNAIKCAIFCAAKDDCVISIDLIWGVLNERLGGILNPSSINTLGDLLNAAVTIATDSAIALDLWLTVVTGGAKLAGYLGIKGIDATLQLLLKLAVNDANDDWILLCEDCPPPACGPAWPSITWFEGTQIAQSGNMYTVRAQNDRGTGINWVIRNTEYGHFEKGNYLLNQIEFLSSGVVPEIYLEDDTGTLIYQGTDFAAANAILPACIRMIQVYRSTGDGIFDVRFTIDN